MKNLKKITALGLSAAMVMSMVPATLASADEETGKVYYLNFKPEQATQWKIWQQNTPMRPAYR